MADGIVAKAVALREALAGFDPGAFSGAECARLAEELSAAEKACGGARLLASARAVDCQVHRDRGFRDGPDWLARQSGTTASQARQALATAGELVNCPGTKEALLAGEVSLAQAGEITRTESETPGAERDLLGAARSGDLSQLRDRARQHRTANTDPAELHRQQHQARHFRHWKDHIGMVCFAGALPPEVGLPFVRRVELAAERSRRQARKTGAQAERWEARAADALGAMLAGSDQKRADRTDLVIVCDLFAWRRGHAHPGETCHLIDGGPIPVSLAQEWTTDAFVKAVLHDGVAIHTVKHFGRYQPAELRTALDLGPVPAFTGAQCADCGRRWGLQYDHVNPVANRGPTTYSNLQPRCWTDHQAKTERDRQAGLLGKAASRSKPP